MWLVFAKELKELVRDRKTLFFMIALPLLLFPAIFGVAVYFSGKAISEAENKVLNYAIIGEQYAPAIAQAFDDSDRFERTELAAGQEYENMIREASLDFVLEVPATYSSELLDSGPSTFLLNLNDAGVNMVVSRVTDVIEAQESELRAAAFSQLQVTDIQQKALLDPISIEKVDVADERENWGEKLGGLVPYLIFILCLQGAMFPATDLGAGEKERGTLETLLISPLERHQLVLGKFFTIAFAGVTAALLTVSSMAIWSIVFSSGMAIQFVADIVGAIGAIDFVLMFLMLIPVVAIFASVLLSLSIYARSFKEAQSYMGSLIFVVILPVVIAMLPGIKLEGVWAWVPLTNVALAIKELIKGTMDYVQLFAIFASTALIAGALIAFCIHWFNKEKVLFR